ncbi:hypothetical protein B0F90DRAFT_1317740 [Multifurca ochricompacta]|uniref:XLF-like N-terminal domain-containing protein n=1 Tax=Multifurca ochricompacta TaxID=376703 RepID=A0AAD4M745_9AGAM|nr:hypothetical protein B0F90DRAFT_1317740 [Multifurca ochricompacta]
MKLHSTFADQSCIFLITDTKTVWVEVLSRQQLSHRWSMLNPSNALDYSSRPDDDNWLDQVLQYLTDVHSPSVISNLSFNVIDSRYSELGVDLRGETFKWRWETFSVGPKQSAYILSKHLIMPLLSTAYLAFSSSDAISEISDCDLEQVSLLSIPWQAIDRIGRTARRSVDTHIRNIFSQSRICTSIRRISALFAFSANLPAVVDELERPELILPSVDLTARSERSQTPHKTLTLPVSSVNIEQAQSHDLHVRGSTNVAHEVKLGPREALNNKATQQDPGRYIPGQATTGDGESSTETGEDDDKILVPPRRQLGKGRGTHARRYQLPRARRHPKAVIPALRHWDLTLRPRHHEAARPQHRWLLTPRHARLREQDQRDRTAVTIAARMAPSAAKRDGVEQSSHQTRRTAVLNIPVPCGT